MNNYRALMRRKLLEEMYDRLSPEEKNLFVQLTMEEKDHREIMAALGELKQKADNNHHSFSMDFAANVAGNGVWDALVWIGSKLVKSI